MNKNKKFVFAQMTPVKIQRKFVLKSLIKMEKKLTYVFARWKNARRKRKYVKQKSANDK